jgi:pilus assembly protein Flp/PilA
MRLKPVWRNTRAQDLIEYALIAGFVAVAAGAIVPNFASSLSTIFSQVSSAVGGATHRTGSGSQQS